MYNLVQTMEFLIMKAKIMKNWKRLVKLVYRIKVNFMKNYITIIFLKKIRNIFK